MIVFVESNFVLELVLKHPEVAAALEIIELAEQGRIRLSVPAFSLVEPHHKLVRVKVERRELNRELEMQLRQIARSADFTEIRAQSNTLLVALAQKSDADLAAHKYWIDRIMKCSTVLPLSKEVLTAGLSLGDLELLDAFVYCSIEADLRQSGVSESVFANRDAKGFMRPTVLQNLESLGCKLIPKFADALAYIKAHLH